MPKFDYKMDDLSKLRYLVHSATNFLIVFSPLANPEREYTASEICLIINPTHCTRECQLLVSEIDLEACLSENTIQKRIKLMFPHQIEFNKRDIRISGVRSKVLKVMIRNLNIGLHTFNTLSAAILEGIPAVKSSTGIILFT